MFLFTAWSEVTHTDFMYAKSTLWKESGQRWLKSFFVNVCSARNVGHSSRIFSEVSESGMRDHPYDVDHAGGREIWHLPDPPNPLSTRRPVQKACIVCQYTWDTDF